MNAITNFEDKFINAYIDKCQTLSTTRHTSLFVYLTKNNTFSSKNVKDSKYVAKININYYDLFEDKKVEQFTPYLTEDEYKQFKHRQSLFFNNDDFVTYNINTLLLAWMFDNFKTSLKDSYITLIKEHAKKFIASEQYMYIMQYIKSYIRQSAIVRLSALQLEYDNLYKMISKLNEFIKTNKYQKLRKTQRQLLLEQLHHMSNYLQVLKLRIEDFKDNDL